MLAQQHLRPSRLLTPPQRLALAALAAVVLGVAGLVALAGLPSGSSAGRDYTGAWVSETSSLRLEPLVAPRTPAGDEPLPGRRETVAELSEQPAAPLTEVASVPDTTSPAASTAPAADRIVLVDRASWDDESAAQVDAALALLPASVRESLGNPALGPLQITVNSEGRTPGGYQPYGGAANFFSTNEGGNALVLYPSQGAFTVLHELGHAYNLRHQPAGNYAGVLLEPEMRSFLEAAGWRVLTPEAELATLIDQSRVSYAYEGAPVWESMSQDNPLEDFANSFALYFLAPDELQSTSPARYAWFAERF